ncbi:hypothetical protein Q8F55_000480 [Vanrija albida]|uniref:VHS domain-containing protein n=1 Tax=Vanrija albida TaxID=181172 RepID=A0ABR3QDD6_9TREE
MSKAGNYLRSGQSYINKLAGEKPHSSITDWVEVLSSDRYDELSLDGIPELVDSVNLQGSQGTTEASRAIRKKLKYGNVHRQLRALVILRSLTENAGKNFQLNWADQRLLDRLREMATDGLLDPKVKKRLILVFHAWSIQYADEPRMRTVAGLFGQYSGRRPAPGVGHASRSSVSSISTASTPDAVAVTPGRGGFSDTDNLYNHSWNPSPSAQGAETYADLSSARADAEERKRQRENRIAMEHREAELERRERDLKRKQEMAAIESRRRREAEEEAERRRQAKLERKNQPKRPKFNFEKEKPQIMVAVANAIQAATNLVNACRLVNRETENITENPRVQDCLDKAKAARRAVIKYIHLVTQEEFVGTLLDANARIVESIQLYDKLSKPAALDSDSEHELSPAEKAEAEQVEKIRQRLAAQKLESQRTGELEQLQEQQKVESKRAVARQERRQASGTSSRQGGSSSAYADLQDLQFGSISSSRNGAGLPPPMRPDSDAGSLAGGSLSDFSDYDSSEDEWRATHSRQQSRQYDYRHNYGQSSKNPDPQEGNTYQSLEDEFGSKGLLDANDPFGDPFADDEEVTTPHQEKPRQEWAAI